MKVAILGCGLIGKKRGLQLEGHQLVGLFDPNQPLAAKLADELHTRTFPTEDALINDSGAEIVIIATINQALFPLTKKCIQKGRHVLVEKPGAISLAEVRELQDLAEKNEVAVKVGFNHRFHPALLKTRELIDSGALGDLMFLRARYGHGGRLGMEKEWRSLPEIGGGGELLDQGVHILDLIYWFLGPLPLKSSFVTTSFWNMKVDDNAVLTVADKKRWATFHVSCSEWKNTFSLELYGRTGKVLISGLGGSYGKETLTYYKMLPEMGPPLMETFEFEPPDQSWGLDLKNLVDHLSTGSDLWGDLRSASYAMEQVRLAYRENGFEHLPCSV